MITQAPELSDFTDWARCFLKDMVNYIVVATELDWAEIDRTHTSDRNTKSAVAS